MRCRWMMALVLMLALGAAHAGGGPQNVLIVVNGRSRESLAIGNSYRRARGIPYGQLLALNTTTAFTIPFPTYQSEIETPIREYLKAQQLDDTITCIVLARGLPQMVAQPRGLSVASLLSAMGLPNKKAEFPVPNPFLDAPIAFTHRQDALRGMFLVTVLNGYNADDVQTMIAQGASADGTAPDGRFLFQSLPHISPLATTAAGELLAQRGLKVEMLAAPPHDGDAVMGYISGGIYSGLTKEQVMACHFRPGALVDLAQNFSATEKNFDESEPPVLVPLSWFVRAGAAGMHGVVSDAGVNAGPANANPQTLFDRYTSGFSLAESYYAALPTLNGEHVILGDPLCAPYAQRPVVTVETAADPLQGNVPVKVTASAQNRGASISRINLYVDDRLAQTLYETARAHIILRVGDRAVTYELPRGATLRSLLDELCDTVNTSPEMDGPNGVRAIASPLTGSLRLVARAAGTESNNVPVSVEINGAEDKAATVNARLERGWLAGGGIDPTNARGTVSFLGRRVTPGDQVTLQVQQERLTYTVPEGKATLSALIDGLLARMDASPKLRLPNGVRAIRDPDGMPFFTLEARMPGEKGNLISYQVSVQAVDGSPLKGYPETPSHLAGGQDGSTAGVEIFFSLGDTVASGSYLLKTTELADGWHQLYAVAFDATSAQVQGWKQVGFQVANQEAPPFVSLPEKIGPVSGETDVPITANEHVARVELYVDGHLRGTAATAPTQMHLPLMNLGRGTHDLWAKAYDAAGNCYISPPIALDVAVPPEIIRLVPSPARVTLEGGSAHRLVGTGFQPNCTVRLAGVPARSVTLLSSSVLDVVSAPGRAARGSVVVTNPDGLSTSVPDAFEYYVPRIARVQISPALDVLAPGRTAQFSARCLDQFNQPIAAALSWDSIGTGTVTPAGAFTAPAQPSITVLRALFPDGKEAARAVVHTGPADVPADGRLRNWLLLGPFLDADADGLQDPYIPEESITPAHGDAAGPLHWQGLYGQNGYLDFGNALTPNIHVVAYAHCYLYAPAPTPCSLVYGATDGISVRLNGELLQTLRTQRLTADPNQNTLPITLAEGWNRLLIKLDQDTGTWGCYLRLLAPNGKPLKGLTFTLDKPDVPAPTPAEKPATAAPAPAEAAR